MQPVKTKKKLSRADKKLIEAAIARANRTDKTQNEDKTAIFEGLCDFLNYFDSSIHFQLSFLNLAASEETFANSISIPHKGYLQRLSIP